MTHEESYSRCSAKKMERCARPLCTKTACFFWHLGGFKAGQIKPAAAIAAPGRGKVVCVGSLLPWLTSPKKDMWMSSQAYYQLNMFCVNHPVPNHSSCILLPRSFFLNLVMEEWTKSIGCEALRKDASHSLVGEATAEPTDESVASLFEPISMILAQFGTQIPIGSKIKVL